MSASRDSLERIAGPDSMAAPHNPGQVSQQPPESASDVPGMDRSATHTSNHSVGPSDGGTPKKKRHRGGRRHRNRRQSFVAPSEGTQEDSEQRPSLLDMPRTSAQQASFYRLQSGNRSDTSLASEALLDHREQGALRSRRQGIQPGFTRPSVPFARPHRSSMGGGYSGGSPRKSQLSRAAEAAIDEGVDEDEDVNDRTPLISSSDRRPQNSRAGSSHNMGGYGSHSQSNLRQRRSSAASGASSRKRYEPGHRHATVEEEDYDVNNPPSVPGSPKLGSLDDVMIAEEFSHTNSDRGRDAVIDIDRDDSQRRCSSCSPDEARRRATIADLAENDVCFPHLTDLSETREEEPSNLTSPRGRRRRRGQQWPNLAILDDWAAQEREHRNQEHIRAKKIAEPVMVGGRLRPSKTAWHRQEEEAPFRYTYFNEMLGETIHGRTISDLIQDGGTFRELFVPDPMTVSDSEDDDEYEDEEADNNLERKPTNNLNGKFIPGSMNLRKAPFLPDPSKERSPSQSKSGSGSHTPSGGQHSEAHTPHGRPHPNGGGKRYGPRPTFWLDVLQPTEIEMKVLAKTFGIHQLTTEDILMEEPREKVELFQSYYFVNYRSFEQDANSDEYMEAVNMYVVVFNDGVISFHHSMTPHPANVRRRIRQLNDYMSPTADWVSYAIIDDITDVYGPLVQQIENEVDEIDDDILHLHAHHDADAELEAKQRGKPAATARRDGDYEKTNRSAPGSERGANPAPARPNPLAVANQGDMGAAKAEDEKMAGLSGRDMLRRVGECRKKVMGLYRLLGNKADVIKGFAKRCNEHWEVAPRSEIGLYLGDIQDHIVTMTSNLSHYENLLSRAHSNYLAQINIRMNERAEQTADVLGKLTVLGTIVLPMNIITGMWGMNVLVPGQDVDSLSWFWCITAGLLAFGLACFFVAKRVYGIV